MKYGFINKAIHSLISCFNTTPTANSSRELAFVVCENQSPKKANIGITAAVAALLALGGVAHGQNSATIDPKFYKTPQTAFTIPNLPSGTEYYLSIKGGESVYVTIDGADANSIVYYLSSPTRIRTGNPIKLEVRDVGSGLINYTENGVVKAIGLTTNYQADIYGPNGDRPDAVIVDPGQTARLSAGPNMTNYYWKTNNAWFSNGLTDSVKNVSRGTYIASVNDGTQKRSNDSIAVVERPVAKPTARRLAFTTTVPGVSYKIYQAQLGGANGAPMQKAPGQASSDTTWVEVPSLAFVGDGNARSLDTGLGIFRIGAIRRPGDDVVEAVDNQSIRVDVGTDIYEVADKRPSFVVDQGKLRRSENVEYYIYDISGKMVNSGYGMDGQIKAPGVYIVKSKKDGGQRETNKAMAR